jgi:hypothetical protein
MPPTLLLFYLYQVGFQFWDTSYAAALTVFLLAVLGRHRPGPVRLPRQEGALSMRAR